MNVVALTGNLGKDAELRFTTSGDPVCSFNFAFTSGFGEKKVTTWLNAYVWGKRAETLAPMLFKGNRVGLVGELTNRAYKAKDGSEKYNLELRVSDLTLLTDKADSQPQEQYKDAPQPASGDDFDAMKDNIPF